MCEHLRYTWDGGGCRVCLDCRSVFDWSELCKIHPKPKEAK